MPFIGNKPADSFTSFAKQDFTTSATTSYTLDYPVANANEIALFINFVRQEPTTAYSASGTSLTLTSATSATDDMYCVFLGKALQTVNPPAGSVGTSQLVDGAVTFDKLSGQNYPAFSATLSADQSISNNTATKVTLDTETFDTDSAFASNKFTVPSGKAGKYLFIGNIQYVNLTDQDESRAMIYKNGSVAGSVGNFQGQNGTSGRSVQVILDLAVDDYIELYALQISGGAISVDGGATGVTFLQGFRIGA